MVFAHYMLVRHCESPDATIGASVLRRDPVTRDKVIRASEPRWTADAVRSSRDSAFIRCGEYQILRSGQRYEQRVVSCRPRRPGRGRGQVTSQLVFSRVLPSFPDTVGRPSSCSPEFPRHRRRSSKRPGRLSTAGGEPASCLTSEVSAASGRDGRSMTRPWTNASVTPTSFVMRLSSRRESRPRDMGARVCQEVWILPTCS